jgi:hypothetical protein
MQTLDEALASAARLGDQTSCLQAATASTSETTLAYGSSPLVHSPLGHSPLVHSPLGHSPLGHSPLGHSPLGHSPLGHSPLVHSPLVHSPSAPNFYDQEQYQAQQMHQEEYDLSSSLFEKQNPLLYNGVMHPQGYSRQSVKSMSKSTSSPSLRQLGANNTEDLEVYVVLRNFQEFGNGFFHKLPAPLRDGLRDSGVCHYMTVFKQQDGTLIQFDFGPSAGGDIHVSSPGPLGRVLNKSRGEDRRQKKVDGQVRERRLRRLPDAHMFMGTTNMSLADIRAWNTVHAAPEYELHKSDCRHYTNALVRYTTGIERAAISALRHQLARNRDTSATLGKQLIRLGQYFTDVANWDRLCAFGHATTAAILTLGGQQTLARVGAMPLLQSVGAKIIPVGARGALVPVKKALFQRPVYAVSTAAVATVATTSNEMASRAPVVTIRNAVQSGMQTCARAVATMCDNVSRSYYSTQQTATKAVSSLVETTVRKPAAKVVSSSPQQGSMFGFKSRASAEPLSIGPGRGISGAAIQQLALIATRR